MGFMTAFEKANICVKRAFLGYSVFSGENREIFKSEVLCTSRIRTIYALFFILIIQILNYFLNFDPVQHSKCLNAIQLGTFSCTLICIVYAFLFFYFKERKVKLGLRNFAVKSFWALMLLCSLFFTYANFVEEKSAAFNITIMVLAISVLPVLTLNEVLAYLVPYMAVNIAIGLSLKVPHYFIQQLIILTVVSIFNSQSQFSSAVKVFTERKHLSDTNNELEKLSETDPLTGTLNRRGLENHLAEYENYYKFSGKYICVLLISIDNFKGRNVLLKTGEEYLVCILECIKSCLHQSTDVIARMGGEEFLIISDTKNEGAIALALRIKRAVEEMRLRFSEKLPVLTLSIGVALRDNGDVLQEKISPVSELIQEADTQLANAKSCGMNCVSSGNVIFR